MAAKRFLNGSDPEEPPEKRTRTRPSFASVIEEAVMVNSFQNLFSALEPLLRRVVNEEVQRGVSKYNPCRSLTRSSSLRIQALEPSSLKLIFSQKLSLPIFTGSKITDVESNPLQIVVVDTRSNGLIAPASLPQPIKIELVVLDGDFPPGDRDHWTPEEFESNIVKERTGKRPLLTGDVNVTARDGVAPIGDIEFTDNSSWIRSRKFRIGAKVARGSYQGVRICEAITDAFVVKDHRGELYKKHHPPMLEDEVWRLEKIGKDGAFHKKLSAAGIKTVQDFLKLSIVEPQRLRKILGPGMSEKMWEVTMQHARKCVMGNKLYIFRGHNCIILLNPICQVVRAVINNQTYLTRDLTKLNRTYIEHAVRQAYSNWRELEVAEGVLNEMALLAQGDLVDQYTSHNQSMIKPFQQNGSASDKSLDVGFLVSSSTNNTQFGSNDWQIQSAYISSAPVIGYSISESSDDGDLTTSRSFINGN